MIASVSSLHAKVCGMASDGPPYSASNPELLEWVHATACFGFLEAYHRYVQPVAASDRDRFYSESRSAAELYGAKSVPASQAAIEALFARMEGQLQRSDIVLEFLRTMARVPVLPAPLWPARGILINAAIEVIPAGLRHRVGLGETASLAPWQQKLVCCAADAADRLILSTNPAVQACRRLGLPDEFLYTRR